MHQQKKKKNRFFSQYLGNADCIDNRTVPFSGYACIFGKRRETALPRMPWIF